MKDFKELSDFSKEEVHNENKIINRNKIISGGCAGIINNRINAPRQNNNEKIWGDYKIIYYNIKQVKTIASIMKEWNGLRRKSCIETELLNRNLPIEYVRLILNRIIADHIQQKKELTN
jgi:hypothetical protein